MRALFGLFAAVAGLGMEIRCHADATLPQPIILLPVPEPSIVGLGVVGLLGTIIRPTMRRRSPGPASR
jgi:hypothetical protein